MLSCASADDIKIYGDWAYRLALNPEKSCYPTYADGIKTKADFMDAAEKARTDANAELLVFSMDGAVQGWISYFWLPEEKYLQIDGCNIETGAAQALGELLDRLETRFKGYAAYFGYPQENREAIDFLQLRGFRCIEESWNHSFFFGGALSESNSNVERITRDNFEKFRAVYRAMPETYWNCDRIYESIDDWTIFVYNQGAQPLAAMFLTGRNGYSEIFGAEFNDGQFREAVFRDLLVASLNARNRAGDRYMTCFCSDEEKTVLQKLGFQCIGKYVLYTLVL